jgi:hypothetical protein
VPCIVVVYPLDSTIIKPIHDDRRTPLERDTSVYGRYPSFSESQMNDHFVSAVDGTWFFRLMTIPRSTTAVSNLQKGRDSTHAKPYAELGVDVPGLIADVTD